MKLKIKRFFYFTLFLKVWIKSFIIHLHKRKCIYFIATPTHDNLGDYAIVNAQFQLMNNIGLKQNIIELTRREYENLREYLKKNIIKKQDIIIIDGGGNIGTLWLEEEYKMRDIVKRFPQNPIFIFPQTAFFEDTPKGNSELFKSAEVYNSHSDLTIFCRDIDTYSLCQEKFSNARSIYTPDIVLYHKPYASRSSKRITKGLICLRSDLESIGTNDRKDKIKSYIKELSVYQTIETTTISKCRVNRWNRRKLIMDKWEEFSSARFVITDRLHGMIFSTITGTPCLALDNCSHKVKNGYEWIKYLPYIVYCQDDDHLQECIQKLLIIADAEYQYDNLPLKAYFNIIEENIANAYSK